MSNHFHILLHILLHVLPPQELADEELLGRVAALYGSERAEKLRVEWASYRRVGDESAMHRLEEERAALLRRMGDLSQYMKELKQWISRDYNKKVGRKGTLWEERFWSCLLEDSAETLTAVAAYIDRNAVRAGIVERPEDYRWCGYAEAHAGHAEAQRTLASLFRQEGKVGWPEAEERYRWLLCPVTDTARAVTDTGEGSRERRNPAFTRALAMGSREFILETYARFPRAFAMKRRQPRPFVADKGPEDRPLCSSHRPREAAIG